MYCLLPVNYNGRQLRGHLEFITGVATFDAGGRRYYYRFSITATGYITLLYQIGQ